MDAESTLLQQAQLRAILGKDPAHFETLISLYMSPPEEQRSQIEWIFNLIKENEPNTLALKLAHQLSSSRNLDSREMAAVVLQKQLTRDESIWPRLTKSTRSTVKAILLSAIKNEESKSIIKKLCATISVMALSIFPHKKWPEILPFMFQCVTSTSAKLQESAFLMFSVLIKIIEQTMIPHITKLHTVFLDVLNNSPNPDVKIAALSALINLILCLTSWNDRESFEDLLLPMMRALTEALNSGQETAAQEALELLIELARTKPMFLRRQIVDIVGFLLQIAEDQSLEEETRHLVIEFVISLAEARERAPGMMRKFPQFISRLFAVLLKMLTEVVDDPAWHSAEEKDKDAGETSNYCVGWNYLRRLAIALGGKTIFPVASEQLPAYLSAREGKKHHAALIALALIAEGSSKVMIKNLEQVVNIVLNSFQHHHHPRVRWAAIHAIALLSINLCPDLQDQYHQRVLPALAAAMDDFKNPRVQAHAARAVVIFSKHCTPEILTPYVDGIVHNLLLLLQINKQMVQEDAVTALASVSDSSEELFKKYYETVMPYLKTILVNATGEFNRMLRAKALECVISVGRAVGKEIFKKDAKQLKLMEVFMSLQGSQIEMDDPSTSYMLNAWAIMCHCLGQDFLPYMSVIMPSLLQFTQLKSKMIISSVYSENEIDDESMTTITHGCKRLSIETRFLKDTAAACDLLYFCAEELKEGFYPWIDDVVPTIYPLLKYYFDEEVGENVALVMPKLLRSAKLAVEKGIAQGRDETYVTQLFDSMIPALVKALHKGPDPKRCPTMLHTLNECVKITGPLLDESHVRTIVNEIKQVITASSSRITERAERSMAEDFDAEEAELLKEENEQEEQVFGYVGELLRTLVKTFKTSFLPFFDELSSHLMPMWGKDKTPRARMIAISIFDHVAEECREAALKSYETYLPFLFEACGDENSGFRRNALYGLGLCAEFGGSAFRPIVGEALSILMVVIRHPNTLQPDNVMAYDNAVSALGKICQFHRDSIDSAQVVPEWLSCLPIKDDLDETKVVHDQLCSMVERSDMELLGPNSQNLPKIVSVFAEVISAGEDLATEETANRMISLLRQLQQTLPPATLASIWSSLQPQQQLALQSILS